MKSLSVRQWAWIRVAVVGGLLGFASVSRADLFNVYSNFADAYQIGGAAEDGDNDGLTNGQEWNGWRTRVNGVWYYCGHNSNNMQPGDVEVNSPFPGDADSDNDGLGDRLEMLSGSMPNRADSDGDGMRDNWEVYVGLDPRDDGVWVVGPGDQGNPREGFDGDPDGDGLSNGIEMIGPNRIGLPAIEPASSSNRQTCPTFPDGDDYTLPLSFDSDTDRLVDSYEYEWSHDLDPSDGTDDADADSDLDGLTTFREMVLHPLLAENWATATPSIARPAPAYHQVGEGGNGPFIGARCTLGEGYLNIAQVDAPGDQYDTANRLPAGMVIWNVPVDFVGSRRTGGPNGRLLGTPRWTNPRTTHGGTDTDGDFLPDGWEVEHGLNFMSGLLSANGMVLQPSGGLGDPDNDTLLNFEEYYGQDGYRIDLRTGTGDETNPWISRIINRRPNTEFSDYLGQTIPNTPQAHRQYQSPMVYWGVYPGPTGTRFTDDFHPTNRPGFFDSTIFAVGDPLSAPPLPPGSFVAVAGAPPPEARWDGAALGDNPAFQPSFYDPFAVAEPGICFVDGDGDGVFTPGVDDVFVDGDGDLVFSLLWDTQVLVNNVALAGGEVGLPITRNVPHKWPMPGRDTDDDGLPDHLEIQADPTVGREPSSPVHSTGPFVQRSARVTGTNGLRVSTGDPGENGKRLFNRDWTIECWVYLRDDVPGEFSGQLINGTMRVATLTRTGYELGLSNSVPYVSFQTIGGKQYRAASVHIGKLPRGRWCHLAGVFSHGGPGEGNALSLSIDGLLDQSLQGLEESSSTFGGQYGGRVVLGRQDAASAAPWAENVWIDEVRIWTVPRTAQEISDNRWKLVDPVQFSPVPPHLVALRNALAAYFPFDDGGKIAEDHTRRAQSSLLGYSFPGDTNVASALLLEYIYGDTGYAIDSDDLPGIAQFKFDLNAAPVRGAIDTERGAFDSDGDGLPDDWELKHELNPFKDQTPDHPQHGAYDPAWQTAEGPGLDAQRDLDGDGLINLYEYFSRTNPRKNDTDENAIPDTGEDYDAEGLINRIESDLATRPDLMDTDDDGVTDSEEKAAGYSAISSVSPAIDRLLRFSGTPGCYLDIPQRSEMRLESWTVEASVLPDAVRPLADGQGASIVRRVVQTTENGLLAANYELRVVRSGTNLVPEARFVHFDNGNIGYIKRVVASTGTVAALIPVDMNSSDPNANGALTRLCATYDTVDGDFRLYVNGNLVAVTNTADSRPPVSGQGIASYLRVGEGFCGFVDNVRLWAGERSPGDILALLSENLTGTEPDLVTLIEADDGGWPTEAVRGSVREQIGNPADLVSLTNGTRVLVKAPAAGIFVGHEGGIAEYHLENNVGEFLFETPDHGDRVYVIADGITYQWDQPTTTWVPVSTLPVPDPVILESVRFNAAPANPVEGDTWLSGGNLTLFESGQAFVTPAPAKVFSEGQMLAGAAAHNDFAWWISRESFYRYDTSLPAGVPAESPGFKKWGRGTAWLADARFIVDTNAANLTALAGMTPARVGDVVLVLDADDVTAGPQPGFRIFKGVIDGINVYEAAPMLDGDRILERWSGRLQDWDENSAQFVPIADAMTDGGNLYLYIRWEGICYKSMSRNGTNEWVRWGYVPTVEEFTQPKGWTSLWERAAQLSGGARLVGGKVSEAAMASMSGDGDHDGLPDYWEEANGLDPDNGAGNDGPGGDPDGDGLNNFTEYLTKNSPENVDSDGDLINDAFEDYDQDGLSNIVEQNDTRTRPDKVDTDDDFLSDWEEVTGNDFSDTSIWLHANNARPQRVSNPLVADDPPRQLSACFDGTGRAKLPDKVEFSLSSWTVQAWVCPSNGADGVVLRRAATNALLSRVAINYELGVQQLGGAIRPYIRYVGLASNGAPVEVRVNGTGPTEQVMVNTNELNLAADAWVHLAGVYDAPSSTLTLYVGGVPASKRLDAYPPWGLGLGEGYTPNASVSIRGGEWNDTVAQDGFEGAIDEALIIAGAVSGERILRDATQANAALMGLSEGMASTSHPAVPAAQAASLPHVAGQMLVRFNDAMGPAAVSNAAASVGVNLIRKFASAPNLYLAGFGDGSSMVDKLNALRAKTSVVYAEPNYTLTLRKAPNDISYQWQWHLNNTAQLGGTPGADIDAENGWDRTTGSSNVVVAIVDSGILGTHPDLAPNLWHNTREVPGNGMDDDGNGYIDDVNGWDFGDGDNDPYDDLVGHGTHVAGIVGAKGNNAFGVCGVAWDVKLMPLKIADMTGGLSLAAAMEAMEYAWRNGARISNHSWGGLGYMQSLYDVMLTARNRNHLFVVAAGNDSADNDILFDTPSGYDIDSIITVAATDTNDLLASFSNYGLTSVDIGAPGVDIYSTMNFEGMNTLMSGTSMSAPIVAGAAALYLSLHPDADARAIKAAILRTAEPLPSLRGWIMSGARVNINALLGGTGTVLAQYQFNDWGLTAEDATVPFDWRNDWSSAATFQGGVRFCTNSYATVEKDTDGDGLPDWWENLYGLDPNSVIGDEGAYGDPDGDGLSNIAEYKAGTDPTDADSNNDGVSDYDSRPQDGSGLTAGELYSDGDLLPDNWEILYPSILSPLVFDEHLDPDQDGWSTLAEYMYSSNGVRASTDPGDAAAHPWPHVTFEFRYNGTMNITTGRVQVQAYRNESMDGTPDAWGFINVQGFPHTITITNFGSGYIREGWNRFFAFIDLNANGTYNEGEPAGLAIDQPYYVGWGDLKTVVIGMSDGLSGYHRFDWGAQSNATTYGVTITRVSGGGSPMVDKMPIRGRTYFHEGDFRRAGQIGLDGGGSYLPSYRWYITSDVTGETIIDQGEFNLSYATAIDAPVVVAPLGGTLPYAKNTFNWRMSTNATQIQVLIRPLSPTNAPVYTYEGPAPFSDSSGVFSFNLPVYAGDRSRAVTGAFVTNVLSNGPYYWEVRARNPKTAWSAPGTGSFTFNLQETAPNAYTIGGRVHYYGPATLSSGAVVIVQAINSIGFSGIPEAQVTLTKFGDFQLRGLRAGAYAVRAFIDMNGNGKWDTFESWGFVADSASATPMTTVKWLTVPSNQLGQSLVIRDRDTDNDKMPDAWEYQVLGSLSASPDADPDNDGLKNLDECRYGTNPLNPDTDGDGYSDGEEAGIDYRWPTDHNQNPMWGDGDGDGVPNMVELVLGTDPASYYDRPADPSVVNLSQVVPDAGGATVKFVVRAPIYLPIRVWLEGSTDLMTPFAPVGGTAAVTIQPAEWNTGPWSWVLPGATGPMRFYRLTWTVVE